MHIPEDHEYRFRIANDVASTLFVMAGAGTGKTTALVARIASLVEAGVPMESIAAITFTRRAANELGVRIRNELERRSRYSTDEASALCTAAIAQLPGASIGTIHGFAQTLLEGWGGIIGLPMVFRVLDTVASEVRLQRSWSAFVESAMASEEVRRLFGWLADLNGDPKV
ncbi:MAG: UvrD-helicase domain-containing protein, partial [Actinomycetota bacterium]|nr:UvrD-helicase domain-containing protein [Actinomycetota bacterium]